MINEKKPDFNNQPHLHKLGSMIYDLNNKFEEPLISIVTPFYNTGKIFHETASSVLNQSFQQFEWIIVNDGSSVEESLLILEYYSKLDTRICVINHDSNKGLSAARNTGIKKSKTELILFIDSDDLLEPTAAEKWFWFIKTHPKVNFVDSYHVAFDGLNYLWTGGLHEGPLNIEKNRISMLCMVRKSVFYSVGGFDEELREGLEDWDFWLKCASHGIWGDTIPEFLAWYRVRKDHSDRWSNLTKNKFNTFKERIKNKYPNLTADNFPIITNSVDLDLTTFELSYCHGNVLKKEKNNLLIILPWLVMGGAERFVLNLIEQLTAKGWIISIVTTSISCNEWRNEFEKLTSDVFVLPNFINSIDYVDFINYLIISRRIDAVFLQGSIEGYRLLPIIRKSNPGLFIVDYLHFITEDWMDGGFPRLSCLYSEFLDMSFVSCKQVKNWLTANQINEKKIKVCYIGVNTNIWKQDLDRRNEFRNRHSIDTDDFVILYAARLEKQKQPLLLLETLRILKSQNISVKTLVAGEGSLRKTIENKIIEQKLADDVFLLGAISPSEMPDIFNAGDLFFLPSENEGVSSAIYEAMAIGLPVVGSKVGGQIELVNDDCGVLIDKVINEPAREYSKIIKDLYGDNDKRKKMSLACRNRIENEFTTNLMGDCVNSTLRNMLWEQKDKKYKNNKIILSNQDKFTDQLTMEYLQARNEWIKLNSNHKLLLEEHERITHEYRKLIEPKPPSHWFYLWIRQLVLPIYKRINSDIVRHLILRIKTALKKIWELKN
ncbi:MAG: hypothetical protein CVU41_01025 [Chloroflexi bacterium HGW-Chloroflexi-3]|nr:MAG: hypothetical protein CVU41_01025 [Chloroflexi bacterium HGW-Chloroflexi-3]